MSCPDQQKKQTQWSKFWSHQEREVVNDSGDIHLLCGLSLLGLRLKAGQELQHASLRGAWLIRSTIVNSKAGLTAAKLTRWFGDKELALVHVGHSFFTTLVTYVSVVTENRLSARIDGRWTRAPLFSALRLASASILAARRARAFRGLTIRTDPRSRLRGFC